MYNYSKNYVRHSWAFTDYLRRFVGILRTTSERSSVLRFTGEQNSSCSSIGIRFSIVWPIRSTITLVSSKVLDGKIVLYILLCYFTGTFICVIFGVKFTSFIFMVLLNLEGLASSFWSYLDDILYFLPSDETLKLMRLTLNFRFLLLALCSSGYTICNSWGVWSLPRVSSLATTSLLAFNWGVLERIRASLDCNYSIFLSASSDSLCMV